MWWIAACLGALLWLLVVRIKLKEKERAASRAARFEQTDEAGRRAFMSDGFFPVATAYLEQDKQSAAVVLLLGHFAWDDKPSEVHMEILPVRVADGAWPDLALECPWVARGGDGKLVFEPPQAHWERLTRLEPWLDRLAHFAERLPQASGADATLEDYHPYAWVRRTGAGVALDVVGEPK